MSDRSPGLDEKCRKYLTYRDLIEAGETWVRYRIDNRPKEPATYQAMRDLCTGVLDPIRDHFGAGIHVTYAFASKELDRLVQQKAFPNTTRNGDQHAGCELNSWGNPVCLKLGLGVDFRVEGVDSGKVALWVAQNKDVNFDRLYFYDNDRPFHVSIGPKPSRQLVTMWRSPKDNLLPLVMSVKKLEELYKVFSPNVPWASIQTDEVGATEVRYQDYLIRTMKVGGIFKSRAFSGTCFVLEHRDISHDDSIERTIDALKQYDRAAAEPRIDNIPTAAEFAEALTSLGIKVQKQHWRMLTAHYRAPDRTLTPTSLAKAAGYGGFSAANAQYGALGRMLAKHLRYVPPPFRDGSTVWTFVMATEAPRSHAKEWQWKLRTQIAEGLERVNAV